MRFLWVTAIVALAAMGGVQGATLTSSGSGDFGAAWGGKTPGAGDSIRILADHTVTMTGTHELGGGEEPAVTVEGTLVIKGKLTVKSDLVIQKNGTLQMEAGSVLEMGKAQVRGTGAKLIRLAGGKEGRVRVAGTEREGKIQIEGAGRIDMTGVDFADLGANTLSLSNAGDAHLTMKGCTWENYAGLTINDSKDGTQPGTTPTMEVEGTDFRKVTGGKFISVGRGAGPVVIAHCTFSGGRSSIYVLARGCVFKENICDNATFMAEMGANDNLVTGNFFNTTASECSIYTSAKTTLQGNYVYVTFNNSHTIMGGAAPLTVQGNVIEGYSPPADHVIPNIGTTTVTRNILIGSGTLCTRNMGPSKDDLITTKRNTVYISSSGAGMIHYCEMRAQTPGSAVVSSNIIVDANPASKDRGVWAEPKAPDQVTYLDYNAWFNVNKHYDGVTITGKKEGDPGFGGHDIANIDPKFVDPSRDLKKWDGVNGGAGTHEHAVEELLKQNSANHNPKYTVEGLVNYVRQGFVPTNRQLKGAGDPKDGSPDIGAMDVQ